MKKVSRITAAYRRQFKKVCLQIWLERPHVCERCGKWLEEAQFHHKVFRSHGGNNSPENIELLCYACHTKIHHGLRVK